jgi:predicted N-acyltransferase
MRSRLAPTGFVEGYQYHLTSTIGALYPPAWDELCVSADADVMLTRRFLQVLEDAPPFASATRYLAVWNPAASHYRAAAVVTLLSLDLVALAGRRLRRAVALVRRLFPSFLLVNAAFCGLSVSLGQSGVLMCPGADGHDESDERRAMRALDRLVQTIAHGEHARLVVYQDLAPRDETRLLELERRGYRRLANLPAHTFPTRFRDFDEYRGQLRANYRKIVRRSQRKFRAAGVTLDRLADPARIQAEYTDETHRLYQAVLERAEYQYEVLTTGFFHTLALAFPGELTCLLARAPTGEVIGFLWSLLVGGRYYGLYMGMDYDWNARCDLYFNLVYAELDYALRSGARTIDLGQTADRFKARLGSEAESRTFCIRGRGALLSPLLRATLPLLEPGPRPASALHVFRDL